MGARRAAVWRCRELVFNRRRFLYGLYRDCGAGASVLGGRLWLFCAALYDHRLSLHLSCDAETVDRLPSRRACDGGCFCAKRLRRQMLRGCDRRDRHYRDHALYRLAVGRYARGYSKSGHTRRAAADRRLSDSRRLHLYQRAARASHDCFCQGHHDLYRCDRHCCGHNDINHYIVVIVTVAVIPVKLGGYGAVFEAADRAFSLKGGTTGIILHPSQFSAYATLALGSALAAFMYPHTMTGVLSANSADTVKKNAVFLPAYTLLLGLIALLGLMAIAAGIQPEASSDVVPALIRRLFPSWFLGFSAAAIAISALVPAAVMSIGAANLFTRNLYKPFVSQRVTPAHETKNAKLASLLVKFGALTFIIFLPTEYAIDLQLLGGIWILQIFPAIVFTLYTRRLKLPALLTGWFAGIVSGTALSAAQGLKPVYTLNFGGAHYPIYIRLIALLMNIAITFALSVALPSNLLKKRNNETIRFPFSVGGTKCIIFSIFSAMKA